MSEYLGKCGNDLIESMMFTKGTALFPIMQSLTTQFVQVVSIFIHAIFQLQVKRVIMNSKGPDWPVYSCSLSYLCSLTLPTISKDSVSRLVLKALIRLSLLPALYHNLILIFYRLYNTRRSILILEAGIDTQDGV